MNHRFHLYLYLKFQKLPLSKEFYYLLFVTTQMLLELLQMVFPCHLKWYSAFLIRKWYRRIVKWDLCLLLWISSHISLEIMFIIYKFRQFAMRNQNYGGGGLPEPSHSGSSVSSPCDQTSASSSSRSPPTSSLLSLHNSNSALRVFGNFLKYTVGSIKNATIQGSFIEG